MRISLGESIAQQDNTIKETLTNIIANKEEIITDYEELKHLLPTYDESKRKALEKLLNIRKIQFEELLNLKKEQYEALLKLLEYLNSLEKKDKNIHIRRILNKMKIIEKEMALLYRLTK